MKFMVIYHVHIVFPHLPCRRFSMPFPPGLLLFRLDGWSGSGRSCAKPQTALPGSSMCCFSQNLGEFLLLPILLLPPLFGGYWWNAMEFGKPINLPFGDGFIPTIYHPFMVISGMICYWVYHIIWLKYQKMRNNRILIGFVIICWWSTSFNHDIWFNCLKMRDLTIKIGYLIVITEMVHQIKC